MTNKKGPEIYLQIGHLCVLTAICLLSSCGFKTASKGDHSGNVISGIITPFLGLIAESPRNSLLLNYATAEACANPVNTKLYKLESDGSIKEDTPLSSQQIGSDARYSFDLKELGITSKNNTVEYIIKAEGCNGDIYKRPVTEFNSKQDVSAKSTVVAEVINASNLVNTKLNEVDRKKVEILINSLDGTSTSSALDSLINKTESANTFTQIFGSSPTVIQDSRPEVALDFPGSTVNELAVSSFKVNAFHVDPNYVFAYKWKLDGVIVGSASTFNYIPSANESGSHQLALYIGKNDGSGNIDLSKPYYANTFSVTVNNNILPTPPNFAVNASTPSPRNINTVQIDLNTGVSLSNCASFSKLAITDTNIIPGILQFNISCATSGTQTETIQFSSGDGTKTLYLWAMDTEGIISPARNISLILDTQPPALSLISPPSLLKGGTTHSLSLSASDAGVGLSTLDLYFSTNGGTTYSLLSHLDIGATQFNWNIPSIDTTNGKLKVVAMDLTSSATTVYSINFEIDSLAPTTPSISRVSNSASNSSVVIINTTCSADYYKILYSQSATTPSDTDPAWENCASTKNFAVSSGDGLKTIYAFTKDIAKNISSSSSLSMTLDTTPPFAPAVSLTGPSISSLSASTFTIADCLDRPYIFVSESMIAPIASDSNWQACSTNANAIFYTLVGPVLEGTHTLYVYAKDSVGNISASTASSMNFDTTKPVLNLSTTLATLYKGGDTITLNFSASDTSGLTSLKLYYTLDGSTYSQVESLATNATNYTWTIPSHNTTTARLKLIAIDSAVPGNESIVYSNVFAIDSTAPSAPVIARSSSQNSSSNIVSINTTCTADYYQILYSESATTPSLADTKWESCSPIKSYTTTTGDGLKTIYAFTKDVAGNTSVSSNISMTLDTTPPTAPLANLTSPDISASTVVNFSIADCLDRPYVLVSESLLAPSVNDPNWQACSTLPGSLSFTLMSPAMQGTHSLYVYAKDSVGNISTSATASSMIYDTTNPTLNLSTVLGAIYKGGDIITLNFSASDTNGLSSLKLYYTSNGSIYSLLGSLAINATNYSWTLPYDNTVSAKLKLVALDNSTIANETIVYSNVFTIDSTASTAPLMARSSSQYSSSNIVSINTTCTADYYQILYSESATTPSLADTKWESCSPIKSYTTTTGDGLKTIYAFTRDAAGNISSSSNITMTLDTTLPIVALTNFNSGFFQGGTSQSITWSASDTNLTNSPLSLSYTTDGVNYIALASNLTNSGSYSWTLPSIDSATVKLKITVTDLAGNSSVAISNNFVIDSTPPSVDGLSINGGALTTTNNNVPISLNAHDSVSKIQFFCLKYDDTTKPLLNSACWKDVTAPVPGIAAAKTITFSGYYFQMGFTKGTSTIYAWVKDEAGQISNNSAIISTDAYSITFDPGTPPTLGAAQVANTNTPATPLTANELITPVGTDLYVKWNASDLEGLAANPITIQYTTDDVNFSALTGGTNLTNGANGSCTVDPGFTGCAKLLSPTSSYYKIRVIAKDTLGTTVFLNSSSLNETKLKILAGNTDDGLNGSAISAIFYTYGSSKTVSYGYKNRLVISDDGKFFYVDKLRGLLWIDPSNGVLKKFIPTTGTSSGDGGAVASATLKNASAIALDYHNNLLIWDFDRLRKVDLATMTITTLLGGGATADPSGTVSASSIQLPTFHTIWSTLIPMPNGDILFDAPATSLHHRKYRAADGQIELMNLQGTGFTNFPTDAWSASAKVDMGLVFNTSTSAVSFMAKGFFKSVVGDTNTQYTRVDYNVGNETTSYPGISPYNLPFTNFSLFTGMDGKIYLIDRFRTGLYRYDPASNTNTRILGTGVSSSTPCAENTLATSCAIDIDSVFIAKTGRIYFIDNGILRTVDDSNKVITLFGQFPSFGNGALATTARFGGIQDIKMGKNTPTNDKIIVEDIYSNQFREFSIEGSLSKVTDANYTWHGTFRFEVDPLTGDIFSPYNTTLRRFVRNTGAWSVVVGGGATNYYDVAANGKTGAEINLVSGYHGQLLGFINSKIYYQKYSWSGTANMGCYLKSFDASDLYRQAHFMGTGTCAGGITNGGLLANNVVSTTNITNIEYFQDPVDSTNKYFLGQMGGTGIYAATAGGNINVYAGLAHSMNSFTHNFTADGLTFYYCSTTGYLYKRVMSTGQTVQLPWLSPTIKCKASNTIIYNSDRNSLIFPITQNGLDSVAEYSLNP